MSRYVLPGTLGLLVGLLLHWAGFSRQERLRRALGLRRSLPLRSGLTAIGWAITVTALLCWLAVIDVDAIEVLPLSLGVLAGGTVMGVAAGLCGFTPSTAFAGLGAGRALEALCVLAGCAATTLLLPHLDGLLSPLQQAAPYSAATLFKATLDEPFLLGGGFMGQGAVGGVVIAIAMAITIRNAKCGMQNLNGGTEEAADSTNSPVGEGLAPPDSPAPDASEIPDTPTPPEPDPEDAAEDTFVALLPGEEPLIIDTDEHPEDTDDPDDASPDDADDPTN